jgi:hypothetical protein
MADENAPYGLLAEFDSTQTLYTACERVRDEGFQHWDAHTPFPVHGLDKAMGMKRSILPWIVLVMGLAGAGGGFLLQTWVHTMAYPLVISAKPMLAWQAYIPVTFETGILLASFGAVFGMFILNGLPRLYHPVFNSDRFSAVTNDKFFIAVEAKDARFDEDETTALLKELGATHVEMLEK